jgi:hypothetical protein
MKIYQNAGQIACNIFIEGGKWMDEDFSSPQYLCQGWPEFWGDFVFRALILNDQNLISHDQSEF